MKIENQVCNVSLAQRLKAIGIAQSAYFYWLVSESGVGLFIAGWEGKEQPENAVSAFSVAELGEILPCSLDGYDLSISKTPLTWHVAYIGIGAQEQSSTEADACAKMLIYLIENNCLNPKGENHG